MKYLEPGTWVRLTGKNHFWKPGVIKQIYQEARKPRIKYSKSYFGYTDLKEGNTKRPEVYVVEIIRHSDILVDFAKRTELDLYEPTEEELIKYLSMRLE